MDVPLSLELADCPVSPQILFIQQIGESFYYFICKRPQVISRVKPNVIVLELCPSRVALLQVDEEALLKQAKELNVRELPSAEIHSEFLGSSLFFLILLINEICLDVGPSSSTWFVLETMKSVVRNLGFVHGTMHILLLSLSAEITKVCGMAPGGEFRCALAEVTNVKLCKVFIISLFIALWVEHNLQLVHSLPFSFDFDSLSVSSFLKMWLSLNDWSWIDHC